MGLAGIDALVSMEKYDSAYHEIVKVKQDFGNGTESQAYYCLLMTKASLLTEHMLTSDSLIDISTSYFEKNPNDDKLSEAYYYKAELLLKHKDYAHSIVFAKKSYDLAHKANNYATQFKAANLISYINCINGNYNLQLEYAKNAVDVALKTNKKKWIAIAYNELNEAYQYQGYIDSAAIYAEKTIPYLSSADSKDLPYILNSIGYVYIIKEPQKAKDYFRKSLDLKPLTRTLENLAYIYSKEGNEEKAYELWKNALVADDEVPMDKIIYHILKHNLSHNNLDGACEQLNSLVLIKDSLKAVLSDRAIQQIQQDYDKKVVSEKHDKETMKWIIIALSLTIIVIFLVGYMIYRKYKANILFRDQQLLVNGYITEIGKLKQCNNNAENKINELNDAITTYTNQIGILETHGSNSDKQIAELTDKINKYTDQIEKLIETGNTAKQQIDELNSAIREYEEQIGRLKETNNNSKLEISSLKQKIEESLEYVNNLQAAHKEADQQIADLNQKIKDIMDQESPRLAKGKLLYDQIQQNCTTVEWGNDDYKCFIDYYKAINFASYTKVVKKYLPKTAHNTFFLLLYEMGKDDKEVRQIMGITQEAIRSTRFRIQKNQNK